MHMTCRLSKRKMEHLMLELRDISLFKQVWLEYGALEWPNGFGIHGNTVVRDGELISKKSGAA